MPPLQLSQFPKFWSSFVLQNIPPTYGNASVENKPAQDQPEGKIECQPLPVLASPGKSDPKSDDPEMPEPLEFSTDDPGSESDELVTGLVDDVVGAVDPAVELVGEDIDDANTQVPELGLALASTAAPLKSQLEGAGFFW